MNVLVFDVETVPDTATGSALYGLDGLSEHDIGEAMFARRRAETGGTSDFLRHHLQRIIAISVLLASREHVKVWSLGEPDSPEKEIVQRFFEGIEKYSPTLVSWNGRGFDLPVLHYRALLHGVAAPRYWETGGEDQSFRWNNYLSRFHERHTDLKDVISGYEARASAPLDEVAQMLGFPGKLGMSGADVWDRWLAGDIAAIRDYCETDVLNTYLVWLRFQLIRGRLAEKEYDNDCARVKKMLSADGRPHLKEFLEAWSA
jgi:hypothetical protein